MAEIETDSWVDVYGSEKVSLNYDARIHLQKN